MSRLARRGALCVLLLLSTLTLTRCALLEMSQMLWTKAVSGGLTKIGKLDPLRVPVIKVDQSEGDTSYRMILRNLEIVGLNESSLESIHIARGGLKSNLSELQAGYVSYSDLRDVESIRYRVHTMVREPGRVPGESLEAANHAADLGSSTRYQEDRFGRVQQAQREFGRFEQTRQYDRRIPSRPDATADGIYRGNLRAPSDSDVNSGDYGNVRQPIYAQPAYAQQRESQGYRASSQDGVDAVDCEHAKSSQFRENRKGNRQSTGLQRGVNGGHYGERFGDVEVSASETVETRLKDQSDVRAPASFNREQLSRLDVASSGNAGSSKGEMKERSGYIDIVYAGDRANGTTKRFGNVGIDPKENRRVYGIEDVMKDIRESARFIIHNFTEGEALTKRNDMFTAAMEAKRLKGLPRYANTYQEQQGYFEEGMQLVYHYGNNSSTSQNVTLDDAKRTKRAHPEKATEDDVMHVILRIRVPLLRVRSQYTLTGKVGKETLRGNGLFVGNFTDLVGDFTLELRKVNDELMIVRSARAKLSTKDKMIALQGMDEEGPVRAVLSHGLMAAEAVAAMLADDFATKGLSEKTADALIYRMYNDLPVN